MIKVFNLLKKKINKIVESLSEKIKKEEKEAIEEKEGEKFFEKIRKKIEKKIFEKKLSEEEINPILENFMSELIEADVSIEVSEKIANDLKKNLIGKEIRRGKEKEIVIESLKSSLLEILNLPKVNLEEIIKKAKYENRPAVFLFFGVNGVGKSLTLSKVAYWLKNKGYKCILGAGDTFRAAGDIQLEKYAEKINVPVIKHKKGADPAAVIFDAISAAKSRGYDVVLGDTSGRMHVKKNLMDELAKIVRVNKPDLKILVLDSMTGIDVIPQFEFFDKAVGVDSIIFSKNDVNEKGGNILSICYLFKKPILFLGNGQEFSDLIEFDPNKITNLLISNKI